MIFEPTNEFHRTQKDDEVIRHAFWTCEYEKLLIQLRNSSPNKYVTRYMHGMITLLAPIPLDAV